MNVLQWFGIFMVGLSIISWIAQINAPDLKSAKFCNGLAVFFGILSVVVALLT